jgi:hypothetical protein
MLSGFSSLPDKHLGLADTWVHTKQNPNPEILLVKISQLLQKRSPTAGSSDKTGSFLNLPASPV